MVRGRVRACVCVCIYERGSTTASCSLETTCVSGWVASCQRGRRDGAPGGLLGACRKVHSEPARCLCPTCAKGNGRGLWQAPSPKQRLIVSSMAILAGTGPGQCGKQARATREKRLVDDDARRGVNTVPHGRRLPRQGQAEEGPLVRTRNQGVQKTPAVGRPSGPQRQNQFSGQSGLTYSTSRRPPCAARKTNLAQPRCAARPVTDPHPSFDVHRDSPRHLGSLSRHHTSTLLFRVLLRLPIRRSSNLLRALKVAKMVSEAWYVLSVSSRRIASSSRHSWAATLLLPVTSLLLLFFTMLSATKADLALSFSPVYAVSIAIHDPDVTRDIHEASTSSTSGRNPSC